MDLKMRLLRKDIFEGILFKYVSILLLKYDFNMSRTKIINNHND